MIADFGHPKQCVSVFSYGHGFAATDPRTGIRVVVEGAFVLDTTTSAGQ